MAAIETECPIVYFRPAPEWRRVAIYCLLGSLVFIATIFLMDRWGLALQRGLAFTFSQTVFFIAIGLVPALLAWRSAIRIDGEGIWRRRLVKWDLWPWSAFMDGAVRDKSSVDSFLYPDKPWYWRHLHLEFLTDEDRQFLHEKIRQVRNHPQLEVPEELDISFGFRRHARFTPVGIQLWRGKQEPGLVISWEEIAPIELNRIDHDRRDFRELKLRAPADAKPVLLTYVNCEPTWKGADAEFLAQFLERHVPPDRLHVNALSGAPLDWQEFERHLATMDRDLAKVRNRKRYFLWLLPVWVAISYSMVAENHGANPLNWAPFAWVGFLIWNILLGLPLLLYWAFFLEQERKLKKRLAELDAWAEARD